MKGTEGRLNDNRGKRGEDTGEGEEDIEPISSLSREVTKNTVKLKKELENE